MEKSTKNTKTWLHFFFEDALVHSFFFVVYFTPKHAMQPLGFP